MLVPNKTVSINESCIYRASLLLSKLDSDISVEELYRNQKKLFLDMADFIDALDLLFILGKIVLDDENGVIKHA
ncbi:hypothetical protein Q4530_02120 [Colwellia sp. 1_MG-2023]|jgi:hypothetical protein|uniref:ABC-three component system middle component 7 n=1 Tax=unclassified Colwellia TaxID=196834 RepID=UPI001C085B37|nr:MULTISPECIES: ABC-three component system middle component 7 [unclassified Colwellia]MBU2925232.1 hypothetical protein [Colwellia sp. C2M11]MDO6651243.1 hypothetical protein [Colwellia sp. 3_MG-2023]MDO6664334.1 hypothetical protein [Colwellia sp. 2_MG-2023]MDO6688552.1 hypothetical protein [Colwellia sp. 1_MG-2023]